MARPNLLTVEDALVVMFCTSEEVTFGRAMNGDRGATRSQALRQRAYAVLNARFEQIQKSESQGDDQ